MLRRQTVRTIGQLTIANPYNVHRTPYTAHNAGANTPLPIVLILQQNTNICTPIIYRGLHYTVYDESYVRHTVKWNTSRTANYRTTTFIHSCVYMIT